MISKPVPSASPITSDEFRRAIQKIEVALSKHQNDNAKRKLRQLIRTIFDNLPEEAPDYCVELCARFSYCEDVYGLIVHKRCLPLHWLLEMLRSAHANDKVADEILLLTISKIPTIGNGWSGIGINSDLHALIQEIVERYGISTHLVQRLITILHDYFLPRLFLGPTFKQLCAKRWPGSPPVYYRSRRIDEMCY